MLIGHCVAIIMNGGGQGRGQTSVWIFTKLKTDFQERGSIQEYSQRQCLLESTIVFLVSSHDHSLAFIGISVVC